MGGILEQMAHQMGDAQWFGHVLNSLLLSANSRPKYHVGSKRYAIDCGEVLEIMQCHNVPPNENGVVE